MKTETAHTPGPLGIRAAKALQTENARRLMAEPCEEFMTQEEIAVLIERETAASDLLAALKGVLSLSGDFRQFYGPGNNLDRFHVWRDEFCIAKEQARAAIAKALT